MPTVNILKSNFEKEMGKVFTFDQLEQLCFDFGIELEYYTETHEETKEEQEYYGFEVASNRIDLLCIEGIVRSLKIFLGERNRESYKIENKESHRIVVKQNTQRIRPFVVGAILRNVDMNQQNYDSFIDLQDKLHQNICRRRRLVSIGTHDLDTIEGPFVYDALQPKDINFIPLTKTQTVNGTNFIELYQQDMKLKQFLPLIQDSDVFPVILDNQNRILSLPPIINSEHSKIKLTTKNIFIEATAIDLNKAHQVLNQLIANFSTHSSSQFSYEQVEVVYEGCQNDMKQICPVLGTREMVCNKEYLQKLGSIKVDDNQMCQLLERMGLGVEIVNDQQIKVIIDSNRSDIMHPCDVAEDLAISYNYNKVQEQVPPSPTIGQQQIINKVSDLLRNELAYAGYKECLNFVLCSYQENTEFLLQDTKQIEQQMIKMGNPKTKDSQSARVSLISGLLKTLVGNKHNKLPLSLFEIGDIVLKNPQKEQGAMNQRRLACLYTDQSCSGLDLIHGTLDYLMTKLNITQHKEKGYTIEESNNPTFFPKRQAVVKYKEQVVGIMGIIHPSVIKQFGWTNPVALLELQVEPLIDQLFH